jgi:hypothetical protein
MAEPFDIPDSVPGVRVIADLSDRWQGTYFDQKFPPDKYRQWCEAVPPVPPKPKSWWDDLLDSGLLKTADYLLRTAGYLVEIYDKRNR